MQDPTADRLFNVSANAINIGVLAPRRSSRLTPVTNVEHVRTANTAHWQTVRAAEENQHEQLQENDGPEKWNETQDWIEKQITLKYCRTTKRTWGILHTTLNNKKKSNQSTIRATDYRTKYSVGVRHADD